MILYYIRTEYHESSNGVLNVEFLRSPDIGAYNICHVKVFKDSK